MSIPALFQPIKIGNYQLKHRVTLCPLTRNRASCDVPNELMKQYYSQRATDGGLLITEATFITRTAGAYPNVPGIYTKEQIDAWKKITDEVHAKGSVIFLQLWHIGRAAFAEFNLGKQPVSASAIAINGRSNRIGKDYEVPRALEISEIKDIVQDYRHAALNAIEAGFDGVEIHSANGYLPDQFINTSTNKRTDIYGESIENRARFPLEIVDAIVDAIGAERTGIRFSPWSGAGYGILDDTPYTTWCYLCEQLQLNHPDLSYIHFIEPRSKLWAGGNIETSDTLEPFRQIWKGPFISAGGYTEHHDLALKTAEETGNLIAFGRGFIANPDLVERLRNNWPCNQYNRETFYTDSDVGYTDYPFYNAKQ